MQQRRDYSDEELTAAQRGDFIIKEANRRLKPPVAWDRSGATAGRQALGD
jgi:hypothetical protein